MKFSAPVFRLKREARLLARRKSVALHLALDEIARREGYRSWNHLAANAQAQGPAARLLATLETGDMLVLAARPGQGKTVLGLEVLAEAERDGRRAVFFSAECTHQEISRSLSESGYQGAASRIDLELSDCLCASSITAALGDPVPGTIAVVDYLQVMDQRRSEPPLGQQIETLKQFAAARGAILIFLSQVHRSFDPARKALPDFTDIRTTNLLELAHFNKGYFLQNGALSVVTH
ncbi:DNA helicase [Roseibium sp. M-1]